MTQNSKGPDVCTLLPIVQTDRSIWDNEDERAIYVKAYMLPQHSTLRIHFMNGQDWQQAWVEKTVQEIIQPHVNIRFVFGTPRETSDVRIEFDKGRGNYSCLGTQFNLIDKTYPTTGFDWLDCPPGEFTHNGNTYTAPQTDDKRNRDGGGTVAHEFLHLLSAVHEHQNPRNNPIQWNEPYIYQYYRSKFGYSDYIIQKNILDTLEADQSIGSDYDPNSIMIYTVPPEFTMNGYSIKRGTQLSSDDIEWLRTMYPPDSRDLFFQNAAYNGQILGKKPGDSKYCGPKGSANACPAGYSCSQGRTCLAIDNRPKPPTTGTTNCGPKGTPNACPPGYSCSQGKTCLPTGTGTVPSLTCSSKTAQNPCPPGYLCKQGQQCVPSSTSEACGPAGSVNDCEAGYSCMFGLCVIDDPYAGIPLPSQRPTTSVPTTTLPQSPSTDSQYPTTVPQYPTTVPQYPTTVPQYPTTVPQQPQRPSDDVGVPPTDEEPVESPSYPHVPNTGTNPNIGTNTGPIPNTGTHTRPTTDPVTNTRPTTDPVTNTRPTVNPSNTNSGIKKPKFTRSDKIQNIIIGVSLGLSVLAILFFIYYAFKNRNKVINIKKF